MYETPAGHDRSAREALDIRGRTLLAELVERERAVLLRFVRGRMSTTLLGLVDAEDVLHDALIQALEGLPRFRGRNLEQLRGWFQTIVVRCIVAVARDARGRLRPQRRTAPPMAQLARLDAESSVELPACTATGEQRMIDSEAVNRAMVRLWALPSDRRLSIVFRDLLGLPPDTLALFLERSVGAALKVHQRARRNLEAGRPLP